MSEQLGAADGTHLGDVIPELDGLVGMEAVTSGGFSLIYRAFQPALNRTVAIKIMSTDGVDRRDRERFSREMGLTGKLGTHPNIVDVYQHGLTRHGQPYLMMPWYDGGSLADGLRDLGPMPPAAMLRLAIKMASALGYAHQHGVLHRDVKPGNILFTALNEPVLADFGIAVDARHAGNATVAWTPNHAAPEVLSYEEPTQRSDIWALASTLYQALAGRPPYPVDPGNTLLSIQARFRSAPPPFVRTDVPASLSALLAKALAPSPDDRPADMAAFIVGLQAIERELGEAVTIPPGLAPVPGLSRGQNEPSTFVPGEKPQSWSENSWESSWEDSREDARGQSGGQRSDGGRSASGQPGGGPADSGRSGRRMPSDGSSAEGFSGGGPASGGFHSGGVPSGGFPSGGQTGQGLSNGGSPNRGAPDGGFPSGGFSRHGSPNGGRSGESVPSGGSPNSGLPNGGRPVGGFADRETSGGGSPNGGLSGGGAQNGAANSGFPYNALREDSSDWDDQTGNRSRSTAQPESHQPEQFHAMLYADGTRIPDEATVVVGGRTKEKPGWSWKRRLLTSALGGVLTAAVVLVGLVIMSPKDQTEEPAAEPTETFVAPIVSGLRATDRTPTSITIAWHTQGAVRYPHRVVIEGEDQAVLLNDDQVKAESAVLADLEPKTKYCMIVNVVYPTPEGADSEQPYSDSSSERKCFSTRK